MADPSAKIPENVPGKWYVDENCIACDSCNTIAPDLFGKTDDDQFSFVSKQPENEEEEDLCKEAQEACPTESIGDDGE